MSSGNRLKLTLIKSKFGRLKNHQACVKGLGLRKMHHSVVVTNSPEIQGMINKISYLVKVEDA